jgi:putative ATP-binding cassette transporter
MQQRLALARLILNRPRFAMLDEASASLDSANEVMLYNILAETGTTLLSVGHRESLRAYHDRVLELDGEGGWRIVPGGKSGQSDSGNKS